MEFDRARKERLHAAVEGRPVPQPADPPAEFQRAFGTAMLYDADIFRAMMEIISRQTLAGEEFARPGLADQVTAAAEGREAFVLPGPSRTELLGKLA